ncbi:Uncharacterised protein [Vibrio cholerae]|nr:Uncharacterised protein [Vibrio cholerae]
MPTITFSAWCESNHRLNVEQNRGRGDVDSRKGNPRVAISVGYISQSNNRGVGSKATLRDHSPIMRSVDQFSSAKESEEKKQHIGN